MPYIILPGMAFGWPALGGYGFSALRQKYGNVVQYAVIRVIAGRLSRQVAHGLFTVHAV